MNNKTFLERTEEETILIFQQRGKKNLALLLGVNEDSIEDNWSETIGDDLQLDED